MTSPVLQYGRVEDWIGGLVMDGLDSDDLPDDVALTGTVKLEPMLSESAGGIRVPTMPKWLSVQPIVCTYSNGRLTHRGLPYVMLLAPNEATNPTNWKWNASFDLRLNGAQVVRKPFSFVLPVYDPDAVLVAGRNPTIVNLTTVQPVNVPGSGTGVVQGPIGFSITGVEIVEDGIQFYREAPGSPDGQLPVGVPVPLPAGSGVIEEDSVVAAMLAPEVREKVDAALTEAEATNRYAPVSLADDVAEKLDAPTGGTTGQVLSKTSGGVGWTDPPAGGGAAQTLPALVNPKAGARWRKALAQAGFVQTAIAVNGDSVTAGGNANDAVITTDADKTTARARSWVRQLARHLVQLTGVDAGEGSLFMSYDDPRWTFATNSNPNLGNQGPAQLGRRLNAGNIATALAQDFSSLDLVCWISSGGVHPARVKVDNVDVTKSLLPADAYAGVAASWTARGANTTVSNSGTNRLTLTSVGAAAVVADLSTRVNVTPGMAVLCTAAGKSPTTARNFNPAITFYDGSNVAIGTETNFFTANKASGVASFAQASGIVDVPAGAATARITVRTISSLTAAETFEFGYFDFHPVTRTLAPNGSLYSYHVDVAAGSHKLEIVPPELDFCDFSQVILRKSITAGVVVHQFGRSGATTADHAASNLAGSLVTQQLLTTAEAVNSVTPISLRIIALGKNDFANQATLPMTPTQYAANLTTLIGKTTALGGCVLLIADTRFTDDTGKTYPEEEFYNAAKALATDGSNVMYLDLAQSWGTSGQAFTLGVKKSGLGIHPGLMGHTEYERMVFDAITRQILTAA